MKTFHNIYFNPAQSMQQLYENSVDLVVTSPPYPMIEMWDEIMSLQNPLIKEALDKNNTVLAFEYMHKELDNVWNECYRVLKNGGFLCINIGDATRTINGEFRLYNNHSRIINHCLSLGFSNLPNIIWRKQTNAPNKFMGSGMMPNGAYVTLEHEYILIFRKGGKREYKTEEAKTNRRESSFFWEERNVWFSDIWDLKGVKQKIDNSLSRERSASYPLEVPYRLINMYSQYGDVVLDPFMGLGTTMQAAMLLGRNSVGYEIDANLAPTIDNGIQSTNVFSFNKLIANRLEKHFQFISDRKQSHGALKHFNSFLNCEVMTKQEVDMHFKYLTSIKKDEQKTLSFEVEYSDNPQIEVQKNLW